MRIAFYLNLQGAGHCRRFEAIAQHFPKDVALAVVGMDGPPKIKDIGRPVEKVSVPSYGPRSHNPFVQQQTSTDYHDFLVNHGDNTPFTYAMVSFLTRWQPDLVVSDVGLEASILARMCGIPVIYGRQHGLRWDKGHTLAYEWACSILAPFAEQMEQPDCPQWVREKTFYSGGFSRFAGKKRAEIVPSQYHFSKPNILVMTGFGGTDITSEKIARAATATPEWQWHVLGAHNSNEGRQVSVDNLSYYGIVENVWPYLCHANLVIANGGHNSTMEIAAAKAPSLCIPAARPFAEQRCKAETLEALRLSIVSSQWPEIEAWPGLMKQAIALNLNRWDSLQDSQAPVRAANHILKLTQQCLRPVQMQTIETTKRNRNSRQSMATSAA